MSEESMDMETSGAPPVDNELTDNPMSAEDIALAAGQEAIVSRFASLLGTQYGAGNSDSATVTVGMLACLSRSLSDDAVICTLPSLDLKVSDDGDNPLPAVGQHMPGKPKDAGLQPIMEASVLGAGIAAAAASADTKDEPKAAQQLCTTTSWTKSSISYAPDALTKNVSKSFSALVDSRLRSWTLLIFKQSLASGDTSSRANLLQMLSASIKVNDTRATFKTLALPDSAKSHKKEADVILPLLFEVVLDISFHDRAEVVTLRAPGTVSGNFVEGDPKGIEKVDIRLDAKTLLASMVDQARLAVFKTVAKVTTTADRKPAATQPVDHEAHAMPPVSHLSGGFSSSLRLTPAAASGSPRLAKARTSALRLNSVLQGNTADKGENASGVRKHRSVQWEPMDLPSIKRDKPPSPKKARMAQTQCRLKSFKSFGRPHAEDTDSGPRNATFGNFGRKPFWGRDGKLVNHPTPMSSLERSRQDLMGVKITGSVNATFGTPAPSTASRLASASSNANKLPSSLPRTATALENWLMNAAGGS